MVRLGWFQDAHIRPDRSSGVPAELAADFDWLVDNRNPEDCYFTGDMVIGAVPDEGVPHTGPEAYDTLWDVVDNDITNSDKLRAAVPGNHEVPIQTFLESDERATLRERIDYDDAGVSVFLVNTQANSFVTGAPGDSGTGNYGGTGVTNARMAYRDIKWLEEQMADAGDNAKLVLPHAATYGTAQGVLGNMNNGYMRNNQEYWMCLNYEFIHETISQFNKVVVPFSHLFQFDTEGSDSHDGVTYAWKKHYFVPDGESASGAEEASTFGQIDIDSTGCTITTIEHSDKTETPVVDVTF